MVERSLYREYLFFSYNAPNRWASPLEEAVATWEEVAFARKRTPRRPKGFLKAVKLAANLSPPGYRDWKVADDDRRGPLMRATVASHIIGQRLLDWPWGDTSRAERAQVPVRYRGDPQHAPSFFVPKAIARPTVRDLERFLRKNGAEIDKRAGKGSHRKFRWRGQPGGYATSRPVVPKQESRLIAKIFGFRGVSELYEAIAESRIIP
jgi:hypothetical protein